MGFSNKHMDEFFYIYSTIKDNLVKLLRISTIIFIRISNLCSFSTILCICQGSAYNLFIYLVFTDKLSFYIYYIKYYNKR